MSIIVFFFYMIVIKQTNSNLIELTIFIYISGVLSEILISSMFLFETVKTAIYFNDIKTLKSV